MAVIRPLEASDLEVLRILVLELHEAVRPFDRDLPPGEEIIEEHFGELLARVRGSSGRIFLAEEERRVIGYLCLFGAVQPEERDERPAQYGFMAELFVKEGYRNRGIGQELVRQAEAHARTLGGHKMELKVLARNEAARRFYESCGYTPRIVIMSKPL